MKVDGVSKKFCRDLKRSLFYGLQDMTSNIFGLHPDQSKLRKQEFWALKDIDFELKRGECLGLIGKNGAGKSTLLKMLNGLIGPDEGTIAMRGKVGALIELGAGFNPILTGRENIFINGSVLGYSTAEIRGMLDEIIAFSELEEFIDTPVQYYSSGMKVRLGFAVAANMEPDVLILDEVLAVGDAGFKIKSFNKISQVIRNSAVIFVSHSMPIIARMCNRVMLLDGGAVAYEGTDVGKGIEMYYDLYGSSDSRIEFNEGAQIEHCRLNGRATDHQEVVITHGDPLEVRFDIATQNTGDELIVMLQFADRDLKIVGQYFSDKAADLRIPADGKTHRVTVRLPELLLVDGLYTMSVFVSRSLERAYDYLAVYRNVATFKVTGFGFGTVAPFHFKGAMSLSSANESPS